MSDSSGEFFVALTSRAIGRKWSHFNQSHRGVLRGWTLGGSEKDGDTAAISSQHAATVFCKFFDQDGT